MKSDKSRPDSERLEIATKIIESYATGEYTITAACKQHGVEQRSTFLAWVNCRFPELLKQKYKDAKNKVEKVTFDMRTQRALTGLDKLMDTRVVTDRKTIIRNIHLKDSEGNIVMDDNNEPVVVNVVEKEELMERTVMPHASAIKFHLEKSDTKYKAEPKNPSPDIPIGEDGEAEDLRGFYTLPNGTKIYF